MKQIYVSDEIHEQLGDAAAVMGVSMGQVNENFIKKGIESLDPTVKKAIEAIKKARQ